MLGSNCGVPANALAYAMNATVVPAAPLGYLTLWPKGQAQPLVSTLNAPAGGVVANAAIVPAGTNGVISAFATSQTHLVLDINGYFAPAGAANAQRFFPVNPCRVLDTRLNPSGEFAGPVLAAGQSRSYRLPLAGCGLPASSAAYSLNATVVPQPAVGYLSLWPSGTSQPLVSTLNAVGDPIVANAAIVPAGTAGGVSSFVTDQNETHSRHQRILRPLEFCRTSPLVSKYSCSVTTGFYSHLAGGAPKDEALRRAKLKFISAGGPTAHPCYWAAFLLTGDGASPLSPVIRWWQIGLPGFGLMGLVAIFWRMARS